jgi:hypothetical protein
MAGMDMNSIASFIEGGAGIAEGIFGTLQANKANKQEKALWANYPNYQIPQNYKDYLNAYKALAGMKLPGYNLASANIDQTTAQGLEGAKEGAISSAQYQDTLTKLNQQSLDAKTKLDLASAQFQANAIGQAAEANYKMGDIKSMQWAQNTLRPWNLKMAEAQSKYAEGMGNVWTGLDTFVQSGYNFADSGGGSSISGMMGGGGMG